MPLTERFPNGLGFSHPPYAGWRLWASQGGRGAAILDDLRQRWGIMPSLASNNTFSEDWGESVRCQVYGPRLHPLWRDSGIKPLKPGFVQYQVSPQPGDLEEMGGSVPTPLGSVKLDYRAKEDRQMLRSGASSQRRGGDPLAVCGRERGCRRKTASYRATFSKSDNPSNRKETTEH